MHELYPAELLAHARSSTYRKVVADATSQSLLHHPSCGDQISYTVRIKDGLIEEIGFQGAGCMLSQAAASFLADYLHHRPQAAITALGDEDFLQLLNIKLGPTRATCALLPLKAVRRLLAE